MIFVGFFVPVKREQSKVFTVSCEGYIGFGCEIVDETARKLQGLPGVRFSLPILTLMLRKRIMVISGVADH
ncbi:hypothetical protein LOK49_LG01G03951 [Camellia lanceoleosa]|uniref:Uncharacterized protein n=1 Tax=Camellia lanceoleosa TaxID=1840588 RepID=A0ACC0IY54_9ERIC|nr:hypothetical protein LOK49_LG01G03951 [Camellia lanceoleosa]